MVGAFILDVRVNRSVQGVSFCMQKDKPSCTATMALRCRRFTLPAVYQLGEPEHSSVIPLASVTEDFLFDTFQYSWYILDVLRVKECFLRGQVCHSFLLHLVLPSRAIKFLFSTNSHSKAWNICGIIFNTSHTLSFKPRNPLMQLFSSSFYRQGNRLSEFVPRVTFADLQTPMLCSFHNFRVSPGVVRGQPESESPGLFISNPDSWREGTPDPLK